MKLTSKTEWDMCSQVTELTLFFFECRSFPVQLQGGPLLVTGRSLAALPPSTVVLIRVL